MTKGLVEKPLTQGSDQVSPTQQKKSKKSNRFVFVGLFTKFEERNNDYGDDFIGFILSDIREVSKKSLISDQQWFNMTEKFKIAFESYKDEELIGKKIQFEANKEASKKGYYTYRENVLISNPDDLEYRLLRPSKVKVL
ncbi:MAG TPA: hypothetical protein PLV31_03985 [Gammaproteobacteria bacterium]|nr:hypothetical protein [Gammaproteobacteria bacterium]